MSFDTDLLRDAVKSRMDGARYTHTLGVETAAAALGELYLPHKIVELRAAALLHDITKSETLQKQLQYMEEFDIMMGGADEIPQSLYHSVTGAAVAARDFPEYATDEVIGAVRWHTTGRRGMTLFELIIYLADYIEDGREYGDCVRLRRYFWGQDPVKLSEDQRLLHLYRTAVVSLDMTISQLTAKNSPIHGDTVECRNYYLELIRDMERRV